ncbi:hypothetical protein FOMPIDRAFT_89914 [Fomitopsis schrenkii]|uniref:DUF6535 domain-containing protein n=1 Tax=Fomitopsis schrenkii TaxID=2126942 RepID=S8FN55_FOMSC|nr:hypothetical protein FOMPIDRAFT_89914 [Fomitopsis schrenkii]
MGSDRTRADIKRWSSEIASLLTFAGLLSAVITGFGALAYTTLAAASDPSDAPVLHRYVDDMIGILNDFLQSSTSASFATPCSRGIPTCWSSSAI